MTASPYLDSFIAYISANNNALGVTLLGASAAIEYVFPPFPGDTVTLLGAFLVTAKGWSFPLVFGVVLLGSAVGAMADFYLGRYLAGRESRWLAKRVRTREAIDTVIERFRRHGEIYIALNRFMPAVRAVFFIAAGMAGLRPTRVLLWSVVSAAAWNLMIMAVGALVGANWERIRALGTTYSYAVTAAIAVVVLALAVRWWVRRRRGSRDDLVRRQRRRR